MNETLTERKPRGYDIGGVPMFCVPVQIFLRAGLEAKFFYDTQGKDKRVDIVEIGKEQPRLCLPDKRIHIGTRNDLYGILEEYNAYGSLDDPHLEFTTLDGFCVHDLRCSSIGDFRVFPEDKDYRAKSQPLLPGFE